MGYSCLFYVSRKPHFLLYLKRFFVFSLMLEKLYQVPAVKLHKTVTKCSFGLRIQSPYNLLVFGQIRYILLK